MLWKLELVLTYGCEEILNVVRGAEEEEEVSVVKALDLYNRL